MKIAVTFQPVFHLPLTLADAQLLCKLAKAHYDQTCKAAGLAGGFMFCWVNWLTPCEDPADTPRTVSATWREMELAIKVLEIRLPILMINGSEADAQRAEVLNRDLRLALDRWPYIKPAAATIDTDVIEHRPTAWSHGEYERAAARANRGGSNG